ncbi:unnamed protein product, partial [Amoebophrya sp. A25]|eukprot:GSA25T00022957001.1
MRARFRVFKTKLAQNNRYTLLAKFCVRELRLRYEMLDEGDVDGFDSRVAQAITATQEEEEQHQQSLDVVNDEHLDGDGDARIPQSRRTCGKRKRLTKLSTVSIPEAAKQNKMSAGEYALWVAGGAKSGTATAKGMLLSRAAGDVVEDLGNAGEKRVKIEEVDGRKYLSPNVAGALLNEDDEKEALIAEAFNTACLVGGCQGDDSDENEEEDYAMRVKSAYNHKAARRVWVTRAERTYARIVRLCRHVGNRLWADRRSYRQHADEVAQNADEAEAWGSFIDDVMAGVGSGEQMEGKELDRGADDKRKNKEAALPPATSTSTSTPVAGATTNSLGLGGLPQLRERGNLDEHAQAHQEYLQLLPVGIRKDPGQAFNRLPTLATRTTSDATSDEARKILNTEFLQCRALDPLARRKLKAQEKEMEVKDLLAEPDDDDYELLREEKRTHEVKGCRGLRNRLCYNYTVATPCECSGGHMNMLQHVYKQAEDCSVPLPGVGASEIGAQPFKLLHVWGSDSGSD